MAQRWDKDRFYYELDRNGDSRERYEEDERTTYSRGPPLRVPERTRERERSVDSRFDRRFPPPPPRPHDEGVVIRQRRVYDDETDVGPRQRRRSPLDDHVEVDRQRVVIEKERVARSPSPQRPSMLRRQSSLDTFDRRLSYYERDEIHEREEQAPVRRGEYRAPPYVPIPLPRSRALPPPRFVEPRDEIQVVDPGLYGDEDFHAYHREREVVRTRRRSRSRDSHATGRSHHHHHHSHSHHRSNHSGSVRSSSRSSDTSSTSSSSTHTATTVKSEYPKKGKTRIPQRLVSKRALIDLGYPFEEEGTTVVVQVALGQGQIDSLLKLSEDYKKSEAEVMSARSQPGDVVEERREEVVISEPPAPPPPAPTVVASTVVEAPPPPPPWPPAQQATVEIVKETRTRDISPARSYTTTASGMSGPVILDARPPPTREMYTEQREVTTSGPVMLLDSGHHHHRRRSASSVASRDIRHEIRHLERQLARRGDGRRSDRELLQAERLPTGELVLYEERVERIEEPSRGVRIEKDKKGPPPRLMRAMLATLT